MKHLLLVAALLGASGCAVTPEQQAAARQQAAREFADAIDDRVPTRTEDCINSQLVDGPQIIGSDTLIYRESGRRLWVSKIAACPSLRPLTTLIVEQHGTQLCHSDRFRVLEPGASIPSAYCRLGRFTAYERPARDDG